MPTPRHPLAFAAAYLTESESGSSYLDAGVRKRGSGSEELRVSIEAR